MVTSMPVWLATYEPMAVDGIRHTAKRVKHAQGRQWCLYGARNGFRALRDFMTPSGHWLTWQQLAARMRVHNPATRVHLNRAGRITASAARDTAAAYKHLSAVYDQKTIKDVVTPFEQWPRRDVRDMTMHTPESNRTHPMLSDIHRTEAEVETYLADMRRLLTAAAPVHTDVWFRLMMKMLMVTSRRHYIQHREPEAILCTHGCGDVETEMHPFFWHRVTHLDQFNVHNRHSANRDNLYQLWAMAVAITVHLIWMRRNATKFDNAAVRRRLRLFDAASPEYHQLRAAASLMLAQRGYRELAAKHPLGLQLKPTFA
ncbi:hypothetical protein H310_10794 [Aphanomyces invadans]|uniref:Uncharacterized protein n=1 Tax=Aphanomyces invadans TaxID=157072 RepID=A0A024TQ14_9STRA|nr:hypothetical protein H310_10794 [Aphanomyces invadans]ETV95721.1 hypothetical protein H310_10794 [Aphanomyces invadans]|eukprot:XP_008875472.1 hypothetical protein H310_10794 [Aphanomyces invadans]